MKYPFCFKWNLYIQGETIKQWPTFMLLMEFWDFWWMLSVQDKEFCRISNCDQSENWIQTLSCSYAGNRISPWLVSSDDVVVFTCASWSRRYCDGKAWCGGIVFRCEVFDAYSLHARWGISTGCGAPDNTDYKFSDNNKVVGIQTSQWKPLTQISKKKALHIDLHCTEDEQASLKALGDSVYKGSARSLRFQV